MYISFYSFGASERQRGRASIGLGQAIGKDNPVSSHISVSGNQYWLFLAAHKGTQEL